MTHQLRPATPADRDFLYALHRATIRPYVEAIWGWDEAWQQARFNRRFDPAKSQIVVVAGLDVGVVAVEESEAGLILALIEIAPDFQCQGIGSRLIQGLARQAHKRGQPLRLQVLVSNRPAIRLYERLGFVRAAADGTRMHMVWPPPEGASA